MYLENPETSGFFGGGEETRGGARRFGGKRRRSADLREDFGSAFCGGWDSAELKENEAVGDEGGFVLVLASVSVF